MNVRTSQLSNSDPLSILTHRLSNGHLTQAKQDIANFEKSQDFMYLIFKSAEFPWHGNLATSPRESW